jgi:hypothetical protein
LLRIVILKSYSFFYLFIHSETTPAVTEKIVEEEAENTPVVASGEEEEQPKESEAAPEAAAESAAVDAVESTEPAAAVATPAVADEPVENGNGDVEPAAEPEVGK